MTIAAPHSPPTNRGSMADFAPATASITTNAANQCTGRRAPPRSMPTSSTTSSGHRAFASGWVGDL